MAAAKKKTTGIEKDMKKAGKTAKVMALKKGKKVVAKKTTAKKKK